MDNNSSKENIFIRIKRSVYTGSINPKEDIDRIRLAIKSFILHLHPRIINESTIKFIDQDPSRFIVRPEPAASHVFVVCEKKDGPILNAVRTLGRYLAQKTRSNLVLGQWSSRIDQFCDLWVAPQPERQIEILL